MKRKVLLSIISLLSVSLTWAQPAQVQINIHLSTNSSAIQGALHGYKVLLWDVGPGSGAGSGLYTDANGDVNMLFTSRYTNGPGHFRFEVRDCQNQVVATQRVDYTTPGAQLVLTDSVFVPCVDPCNASARLTGNNGNRYQFYAFSGFQNWDMNNARWDFSDGTSYTGEWITKQFPLGTYSWKMTHQGCAVDSGSINVTGTCYADFSVDTATSGNGVINIFNNSVATSAGNTLYHLWHFGDGTTSTLPFPQHQYSGNGPYPLIYPIYLSITEVDFQGDTICQSWHGDSLFIDSTGNLLKTGFTINIMAPNNSVSLTDDQALVFAMFPQPASEAIRIETNVKIRYAELVDLNGRLLQDWPLDDDKYVELLLEKQPPGMYVLRIHSDQGISTHKCLIK